MTPMTPRRQEVLDFVVRFIAMQGRSPLLREIGLALGMSRPTAHGHVTALVESGHLTKRNHGRCCLAIGPNYKAHPKFRVLITPTGIFSDEGVEVCRVRGKAVPPEFADLLEGVNRAGPVPKTR